MSLFGKSVDELYHNQAEFKDIYSDKVWELLNGKKYPRWEREPIGTHWEDDPCDCGEYCDCPQEVLVIDEDAVWIDVWKPYERRLFDLLPKKPWLSR